jgi:hypothetical protein
VENTKQSYQAPELKEWGAVADVTQISKCVDCFNGSVVVLVN